MDNRSLKKLREKVERNKLQTAKLEVPTVLDVSGVLSLCDIQSKYRQKIRDNIAKQVSLAKPRLSYEEPLRIGDPTTDMRQFAEKSKVPRMSRFLEKKIKKRLGVQNLQVVHSKALDSIMSEVHEEFIAITHQTGVRMKVKILEGDKPMIEPYKYLGKSENYQKYLRTRKKLLSNWILHLPLLRRILYECITNLPHSLFDLSSVFSHPLTISDIETEVQNKIWEASQFLKEFYRKITVLADDTSVSRCQYDIDLHRYYGACTGLMSIHLSRCITHTIENIVEFTSPYNLKPYLVLLLVFEESAVLIPNQDELVNLFTNFIKKLIEVGNQFFVLQRLKLRGYETKHIFLCITDDFIHECVNNIRRNVEESYEPVLEYIRSLNSQYQDIYEDVSLGQNKHFSDIKFEDGYANIMFYKEFLFKIFHVPSREYFSIGQVILSDYVDSLTASLKLLMDNIFRKLALQHEYEVNDINETFRLINYRARKEPKTTEELVEIGRYMVWVRDDYFGELNDRVDNALSDVIKLITLGPLSERHMYLNCAIKNWLDKLPPIMTQYFSSYDQLKFEAEENLQAVIEEVTESVKRVYPLLDILNNMDDIVSAKEYLKKINLHMIKIKEIEAKISWINQEEVCLSFPKSNYSEYESLKDFIYPFYHLLKLCLDVQRSLHVWEDGQLDFICYNTTKSKLEQYELDLIELQKTYRNKIRQSQEENTPIKFKGTVDDPDILNWPAPLKLCGKALQLIDNFKPALKIIKIMCNPALKTRHWTEMSKIAGFNMQPDAGTTLRRLREIDYGPNFDKYELISESATKEAELIAQLNKMENTWLTVDFVLILDEKTECQILDDFQTIHEIIDDNSIQVSNMKRSIYVKPYEDVVEAFSRKLQIINRTLEESNFVQRIWLDFSPIFLNKNIANKLTDIASLFFDVDSVYRTNLGIIVTKLNVMGSISDGKFLDELLDCKEKLEIIRHGLWEYLESIRTYFPRLYFLPNDELIMLLSRADDMKRFEHHLNKLFSSVSQLICEAAIISGIRSDEKEELFFEIIDISKSEGLVEVWLKLLEERIFLTIKHSVCESAADYSRNTLDDWMKSWPGHILLIILKVVWTADIHEAVKNKSMQKVLIDVEEDIERLSATVRAENQQNLIKLKIHALLMDAIHRRSVTNKLLCEDVQDENEFMWLSQLRYYLNGETCQVKLLYASIIYGNEYINNFGRLVMTPLTERCYRTLFSAYHMHLYASPVGPAGTGKTETVKELAKSLGVLCVVFSCSEKFEFRILTQILKGMASCGCWVALDEFNRITVDVLSVISQIICSMQLAVKSQSPRFTIENSHLNLKPTCFMCITMNPDYPGRSMLPENLKMLFRNVAMMVPDSLTIAEVSLASCGFENSREISVKLVAALQFMAELLSPEKHYDFGIRTLKLILKDSQKLMNFENNITEESVVTNSLIKFVKSRISEEDRIMFDRIVKDIFPAIQNLSLRDDYFRNVAFECCKCNNIQLNEDLFHKLCELNECLRASKGVVVLGDTDSGKSTVIKMLANILEFQHENYGVNYAVVNPKSLTICQLYGEFDNNSQRWSDGVVSKYFRKWAETTNESQLSWIIFDGPLETEWVENLNSVLDDNKKLCLSSGEIINVNEFLSLIFEVTEMRGASPATVSRCSVIYVKQCQDSWKYITESWTNNCQEEWYKADSEHIKSLLNWIIPGSLKILRRLPHHSFIEHVSIRTTLMLFRGYLDDILRSNSKKEEEIKNMRAWIHASLIQACIWGFLPSSNIDLITKFNEAFRILWKGQDVEFPYPNSIEKLEVGLPADSTVYDSAYIYKQKGNWKNWSELIKSEKISENPLSQEVLVPTVDTARYGSLLGMTARSKFPVLLVGPSGSGKTIIMRDFLMNKLNSNMYESGSLSLTFNVTTNEVQNRVLGKLNKIKSCRYAPTGEKSYVLFIDDLHSPSKNEYKVQAVLELLRQHLDHNIWYDSRNLQPIQLERILFTSAVPTEKFSSLSLRLLRHFSIFFLSEMSQDICCKLYSNLLFNCWRQSGFPADIMSTVNQITQATWRFYLNIRNNLKPTPENYHYQFNLFDYSRVISGCLLLRKDTADTDKKVFCKVWTHEIFRVFGDRITNSEHGVLLIESLRQITGGIFNEDINQLFEHLENNGDDLLCFKQLSQLFFQMKCDKVSGKDVVTYEEVSLSAVRETVSSIIIDYNEKHEIKLDIVLFNNALANIMRIAHVLFLSKRNALIIGMSGSGRKTASLLAALLVNQKLFNPSVSEESSGYEWRKEMKAAIMDAGARGTQSVILIDDFLFDRNTLFNDIDFMLKADDLQVMFDFAEQQIILNETRSHIKNANINLEMSASTVLLYFNKCCKENLHVLLCVGSTDLDLRNSLHRYSSIMKYCDKIMLESWPNEGLQDIADSWLKSVDLDERTKNNVRNGFLYIHDYGHVLSKMYFDQCGIENYISTTSYLEMVKSYTKIISLKQKDLRDLKERYDLGLDKLSFAAQQISRMQQSLSEYQPQLEVMTKRAKEMTEEIATETIEVGKASALVRIDEKIANEQAIAANFLKLDCEADLALAIPILEDAISALNTLKPSDITLVKSMKNPPDAIKLVMAAVCVIKDVKPDRIPDPSTGRKIIDYWGPSKRILGDMNFLQSLKDFDKDHIKPEIIAKIRKEYLPHKDFAPHIVAKASSAAEGLCKWIIAMDMYDKVAKEVAPKKEKFERAEKEYAQTLKILKEKKEEVERIEQKLANLNSMLEEARKKQQILQREVDLCNKRLERAQRLISGLGGEKERWTNVSGKLQRHFNELAGDILISSGIIAYLSPFPGEYRKDSVRYWHVFMKDNSIPCSDDFDFTQILGSEAVVQEWHINHLPLDDFFVENAIINAQTDRWPLFLDPQFLAKKWIQQTERNNNLCVIKASDSNLIRIIRVNMKMGKPVLIEGIKNDIEVSLESVLLKKLVKRGDVHYLNLCGTEGEYNPNFRLYLMCYMRNPQYKPDIFTRVCIINFALTFSSLTKILLDSVIGIENPINQKRDNLLNIQTYQNRKTLKQLEEKILQTLSESKADILEDERALKILDESKDISKKLRHHQETVESEMKDLDDFKQKYLGIAEQNVVVFDVVSQLYKMNIMYQYSLDWFLNTIIQSVQTAERSSDHSKRIMILKDHITYDIFISISKSLYIQDRVAFTSFLSTKIGLFYKTVTAQELSFLIEICQPNRSSIPTTDFECVSRACAARISKLIEFDDCFKDIRQCIEENTLSYQAWMSDPQLDDFNLHSAWYERLSDFKRLMVASTLRPDKTSILFKTYTKLVLGEKYNEVIDFEISAAYIQSSPLCPLIFLLSIDADPMNVILQFAKVKNMLHKLHTISLGKCQKDKVIELIGRGQREGLWICLVNCHLASAWISQLESTFIEMTYENTHENFRLWLTTFESEDFPVFLLQNSVKMVNQSPPGIKHNLLRNYMQHPINDTEFFYGCPHHPIIFARLLYSLAFFHAIIQERKRFDSIGWNIPYEFKQIDFYLAAKHLQIFVEQYDDPFESLLYLIGECDYGGRVSDDFDQRLFNVILKDFLSRHIVNAAPYIFHNDKYKYSLPRKNDYLDYIKCIEKLPEYDPPELFGLHENMAQIRSMNESMNVIMKITQLTSNNNNGTNFVTALPEAKIVDIISQLPEFPDIAFDGEDLCGTVLSHEVKHYKSLYWEIKNTLEGTLKSIRGENSPYDEAKDIIHSIFENKIPKAWLKLSYSTIYNLGKYLTDFQRRLKYLSERPKSLCSSEIWFPVLFHPNAFLAAVKQYYSKQTGIPLEKIKFSFRVDNFDVEENFMRIGGLIMEGARWNKEKDCIDELLPNMLYDEIPKIVLEPQIGQTLNGKCLLPVYRTSERRGVISTSGHSSNYIFPVLLNINMDSSHWIKRGVSLVCQVRDYDY